MDINSTQRSALERQWLDEHMQDNPMWKRYSNDVRDYVYLGKEFYTWDMLDGLPKVKQIYKVTDIALNKDKGLSVVLTPRIVSFEADVVITHKPKLTQDRTAFFWLPSFVDLRVVPISYDSPKYRRVTVPICIRTEWPSNSRTGNGTSHCASRKEFLKFWPDFG
jgi:hypothetical protein